MGTKKVRIFVGGIEITGLKTNEHKISSEKPMKPVKDGERTFSDIGLFRFRSSKTINKFQLNK